MQNEELKEQVVDGIGNETLVDEVPNSEITENEALELYVSDTTENVENTTNIATDLIDSNIANLNKVDAVALLIKKAKILVEEADEQLDDCQVNVKKDLQEYEDVKSKLKSTVLDINNELLKQLDYQQEQLETLEAQEEGEQYGNEIDVLNDIESNIKVLEESDFKEASPYEVKNTIAPMYIQEPSSGKFGGFLMGLIAGGATFAGMAYFASTKLGITLDPSKLPDMNTCKPIFEWYSKLIGQTDPNIGLGIMGGSALLVLWIIYAMKKSAKATKNLEFAKDQLNQAEAYSQQKVVCKESMEQLDEHIKEAVETFKLYDIVLNEQKAKLNRIMFIEEDKIANGDFHDKSLQEIKDTRTLVDSFKDYLSTSISDEDGKLSSEIVLSLRNMKLGLNQLITRLY